jgi:hypothetical protein
MTIRGPFAVTLLVVLFVSLAANLVVAGFSVARFSGGRPPGFGGDLDRLVTLGIGAFPPEIQDNIRQKVQEERPKFRDYLMGLRQTRQKMFDAMRAADFNRQALDDAFAELRGELNGMQVIGQSIVADAVQAAPPAARQKIRPPRGPFP